MSLRKRQTRGVKDGGEALDRRLSYLRRPGSTSEVAVADPRSEMFSWYMGYHRCVHTAAELAELRGLYPVQPNWRPTLG